MNKNRFFLRSSIFMLCLFRGLSVYAPQDNQRIDNKGPHYQKIVNALGLRVAGYGSRDIAARLMQHDVLAFAPSGTTIFVGCRTLYKHDNGPFGYWSKHKPDNHE